MYLTMTFFLNWLHTWTILKFLTLSLVSLFSLNDNIHLFDECSMSSSICMSYLNFLLGKTDDDIKLSVYLWLGNTTKPLKVLFFQVINLWDGIIYLLGSCYLCCENKLLSCENKLFILWEAFSYLCCGNKLFIL